MSVAGHREGFRIGQGLDTRPQRSSDQMQRVSRGLSRAAYLMSLQRYVDILNLEDGHPRGRELTRRNIVTLVLGNTAINPQSSLLPAIARKDIAAIRRGKVSLDDHLGTDGPPRPLPGRLAFEDKRNRDSWRDNFEWENEELRTALHPGSTFPEDMTGQDYACPVSIDDAANAQGSTLSSAPQITGQKHWWQKIRWDVLTEGA